VSSVVLTVAGLTFAITVNIGYKYGKIRAVEFAPTTGGALFGVDRFRSVVEAQNEHPGRTELDAESAAFTPVIENVNLAPRQTPFLGTRSLPGL
jgi:hypothetical protein